MSVFQKITYTTCFILILCFTPLMRVLAQEEVPPPDTIQTEDAAPTPQPVTRETIMMGATPAPPSNGKLPTIWRGMSSVAKTSFGTGESFWILAGTKVGFTLEQLITPWFESKEKEISVPNLIPHADLSERFAPFLLPQNIQDKTVHYSEENKNILSNRFCAVQVNKPGRYPKLREDIESVGNQLSSNVDKSQSLFERARIINSVIGLQFIEPTTVGSYDMNLAPEVMGGGTVMGFCDWNFLGLSHPLVDNHVVKLSSWGGDNPGVVYTVLETIIASIVRVCKEVGVCHDETEYEKDTAALETRLTEVGHDSNFHQLVNIGDLDRNDPQSTKAFKKAPYDWTRMLEKTRGWAFNFLPEKQIKVRAKPAATTDYSYAVIGREPNGGNAFANKNGAIAHPWPFLNNATQREKEAACIASPHSLQQQVIFGTAKDHISIGDACGDGAEEASSSGKWNCKTDLGELASEQTNQAGLDWATNNIYDDSCPKDQNAWTQCHSDVIAQSKKACVDPLFALTIWLHESAASNYMCGEQLTGSPVEDFGIHTASTPEDFTAQLGFFLNNQLQASGVSVAGTTCPKTLKDWVSVYYIGNHCYNEEPDKAKIDGYIIELQDIYTALGGGALPAWPKQASC